MASAMAVALSVPAIDIRAVRTDRVVVMERDPALGRTLQILFSDEGYQVEVFSDEPSALNSLRARPPAAVILDLQWSVSAGSDLCREITNAAPGLPVIVLSATSEVVDKVLLLEMGADDFVTKPFSSRELLARTRALIRRASRVPVETLYAFDDILVDFSGREVTRAGEIVPLTPKEYETLEFLVKNERRVISRDEMLNEVWGYENYPCTRTVDNHILRLRRKLEDDFSNPDHLLTIHGVGYKFMP